MAIAESRVLLKNEDGSIMTDLELLKADICPTCLTEGNLQKTSKNLQKIGIRKICRVCGVHHRY